MKRTKVTSVTNPKALQGSFQTFRTYLGCEATFRSDKPLKTQESWYWPRLRFRFWISLGTTLVRNCTKASWNKAAVEPVHYYRPQLTQNWFSGTDSKGPVLCGLIVQFKQKRGTGVEKTVFKKLLVRTQTPFPDEQWLATGQVSGNKTTSDCMPTWLADQKVSRRSQD